MNDPRNTGRNPLLIPDPVQDAPRRVCPVCKKADFGGHFAHGMAVFKCRACGNEWVGGVGMEPARPSDPTMPQNPKDAPLVDFARNQRTGEVEEFRPRRPDLTQAFRKGAPMQGDDDV